MTISPIRPRPETTAAVEQLRSDLLLMKGYLQMCVRKEDWHGVMDASADIREIIAKLAVFSAQEETDPHAAVRNP